MFVNPHVDFKAPERMASMQYQAARQVFSFGDHAPRTFEVLRQLEGKEFPGLGFGVWGLGFGVWGLGFGVWALGFGLWGLGFGVWGLGFGVWGLGFGVWGLGFGVWGLGFGDESLNPKPCKMNPSMRKGKALKPQSFCIHNPKP